MEARPNRPGHVGHTPQPVSDMWQGARRLGVLAASTIQAAITMPRPIATAALPRLQTPEKRNSLLEHVQAMEASRVMDARQPWPFSHREGFELGTAPRRAT